MAQEKQQPIFESNPCIRFRDNCQLIIVWDHDLCWQSQAELKIKTSSVGFGALLHTSCSYDEWQLSVVLHDYNKHFYP